MVLVVYTEPGRLEMVAFLPPEVILAILSCCDYATAAGLTMTCTSLNRYPRQSWYAMEDLLQIERWPCYDSVVTAKGYIKQPMWERGYYACSYCLRLRSAVHFSNAMMGGRRGKHPAVIPPDDTGRLSRVCIECGINHGRYRPGDILDFGGVLISVHDEGVGGGQGVVCRVCRSFSRILSDTQWLRRSCTSCAMEKVQHP